MELGNLRKTGIVRMRNYGRIIQDMVLLAANEQDVEMELIILELSIVIRLVEWDVL